MSNRVAGERTAVKAEGDRAQRLLWVDALRGYAIIDVIGDHLYGTGIAGGCGVQLFFLVSAYSLLHSVHHGHRDVGSFYVRRLFRVAPMFWLAIPLFAGLRAATGGDPHTLTDLLAAISFLFWVPSQWKSAMVPGSWSISCEVLFYLIFPLLVLTIDSFRKALVGLFVMGVVAAIAWPLLRIWAGSVGLSNPATQNFFAFHSVTTQLPVFLLGFCLYFAPRGGDTKRRSIAAGAVGLLVLAAGIAVHLNSGRYYFVYAGSFLLIAYALSNGAFAFIANRYVAAIGVISYSAYFWHFFWLGVADSLELGLVKTSLFVISLTLLCAAVTYRIVEQPGIRLGSRLAAALRTRRMKGSAV